VEKDKKGLQEMLEKSDGYTGIPVIDIDGTIFRGFSPRAIEKALKQ